MPETKDVLIKVRNLKTYYPVKQGVFKHTVGHVKAVDDVSLDVYRGEILGVVGESGCVGKEHPPAHKAYGGKYTLCL